MCVCIYTGLKLADLMDIWFIPEFPFKLDVIIFTIFKCQYDRLTTKITIFLQKNVCRVDLFCNRAVSEIFSFSLQYILII